MNAAPPPGNVPCGALLSLLGVHLVCGKEFGAQMVIATPGDGGGGQEPGRWLVVADVMAVVVEALVVAVDATDVGAEQLAGSRRLLDRAVTVAVEFTHGIRAYAVRREHRARHRAGQGLGREQAYAHCGY